MLALVDGDILRYEIGYAAEAGWRMVTKKDDALPPWDYVQNVLDQRLELIKHQTDSKEAKLYYTEGHTFRFDVAKRKPYKGTRVSKKPWHFQNLTVYMRDVLRAEEVTVIEADDALAIAHVDDPEGTILCSRDKDLRQVPGWFYSWELGLQPQFGPYKVDVCGHLSLDKDGSGKPKLTGSGFKWFAAQTLMGDPTDNIPGLPKCGPVATYEILNELNTPDEMTQILVDKYEEVFGNEGEEALIEQGILTWMVRRLNEDGSPQVWEIGLWD